MIRFVVTEHATDWYCLISGMAQQAISTYDDLKAIKFLLSPLSPANTEYEYDAGSRPVRTGKAYGAMRDKGVSHLTAQGTISLQSHPLVIGSSSHGIPTVTKTANNAVEVAYAPYYWGEHAEAHHVIPEYISGSYKWSTTDTTCYFEFLGDKAILVTENKEITIWYEGGLKHGQVYTVLPKKGRIQTFYRSGSVIKTVSTYNVSGSYFTAGQRAAYLAAVPVTGGTTVVSVQWKTSSANGALQSVGSMMNAIQQHLGNDSLHLDHHPADFGELAMECAAQLKFVDQNILLLVLDVNDWRQFHSMWKSFANTDGWRRAVRAFQRQLALQRQGTYRNLQRDFADMFKPGASAYLFEKYAVLPSIGDLGRLMDGASRSSRYLERQRLHSRKVTSIADPTAIAATHTAVITVQCAQYPTWFTGKVQALIGEAKKWGVYPEMQNLWDLLPYSFVVDWFIPLGDAIKGMDSYFDMKDYFPVDYCVMSEKWEVSKSITTILPGVQATGVVDFSYYTRWISRMAPRPTVSLSVESPSTWINHAVEGSALVLQRL